jgi:hypothetical protein
MTSAFKLRGVECPLTIQTSTPLPHTLGPGDLVRDLKIRGRHGLGGRVASALSPRPLITMARSFAEPLANPLLRKWLCVLKDAWFVTASHLPAQQGQSIRQGRQLWEIQSFLSALSFAGDSLSLRSHSRQRASVLPNIREWLLPPQEDFGGRESSSKSCVLLTPQSHSR